MALFFLRWQTDRTISGAEQQFILFGTPGYLRALMPVCVCSFLRPESTDKEDRGILWLSFVNDCHACILAERDSIGDVYL